jgi:hypothetical protein
VAFSQFHALSRNFPEGTDENHENSHSGNLCPGGYTNRTPSELKAEMIPLEPSCPVTIICNQHVLKIILT